MLWYPIAVSAYYKQTKRSLNLTMRFDLPRVLFSIPIEDNQLKSGSACLVFYAVCEKSNTKAFG